MFGPAESVTSFASVAGPRQGPGETLAMVSPDFSVALHPVPLGRRRAAHLQHRRAARPRDEGRRRRRRAVRADSWDYRSPVYVRRWLTIRRKTFLSPWRDKRALAKAPHGAIRTKGSQTMDFCRGPAEVAAAIKAGRPSRLSASFALHVTELALAIHDAPRHGSSHVMTTDVDAIEPMPWAA